MRERSERVTFESTGPTSSSLASLPRTGAAGKRLVGVLHGGRRRGPGVVCAHGFESTKESRKFVELAGLLEGEMAVLRFDFRGCGESPGGKFLEVPRRQEDLASAIRFLRDSGRVEATRIGLMGSSLGGYLSILAASRGDIGSLVTLASPARIPFLPDARRAIARVRCPIHLVHGTRDTVVPPSQGEELYRLAREPKELRMVDGADHQFSDDGHRARVVGWCAEWLRRDLGSLRSP
ncbi:MAG: alpha/beta fold hydrolase [Euryarchaeota archaeon]|nr:alpha/beta fold hydrolase [Euryarchaeota archaeon]